MYNYSNYSVPIKYLHVSIREQYVKFGYQPGELKQKSPLHEKLVSFPNI